MSLQISQRCFIGRRAIARTIAPLLIAMVVFSAGCSPSGDDPPAISLVQEFAAAEIEASPAGELEFPRLEWRFDGEPSLAPASDADAKVGWSAFNDVCNLRVEGGMLQGRAGATPILTVAVPEDVQVIALGGGDGVVGWIESLGPTYATLVDLGVHV